MVTAAICMMQLDDTSKQIRIVYGMLLVSFFITVLNSRWLERTLGSRTMIRLGSLSFAIYVVHWPIIESFSSWYYIKGLRIFGEWAGKMIVLSDLVLTFFVILFVAELLNKYVISLGMINNTFWKSKIETIFGEEVGNLD